MSDDKPLGGRVALVAGATRGAGRGIACMLGQAGATVVCTGRSVRGRPATPGRPETLEETAEMVTAHGGTGIAVPVDHLQEDAVRALVEHLRRKHRRLDILVDDVWGGDAWTEWGKPFWELSLEAGSRLLQSGLHTHLVTVRHVVPLMLEGGAGLVVEITDGDTYGYRGNLYYDLVKTSLIRLAFVMARELRKTRVTALGLTPGYLRSEAMLERYGVSEANWRDGAAHDPHFIASETPFFVGRAVAALAADPDVGRKAGRVWTSWDLALEYGFTDVDGSRPHWGRYFETTFGRSYRKCDAGFYETWADGPMEIVAPDWP
jgi:NAD(P)-dependent dehydrogenase (short-subunit alcohol dehydrogenase family)